MWISDKWTDFKILDTSCGEKLEQWGKYRLIRPDPQIIWETEKDEKLWGSANAQYHRSENGGGSWLIKDLPQVFDIKYGGLNFKLKPMGFKHTGLFPEQACNWDWAKNLIEKSQTKPSVLNLFAYTGSFACLLKGRG